MQKNRVYWNELLGSEWTRALAPVLRDPYMEKLTGFIAIESAMNHVYPSEDEIFKYFKLCPLENLKIVVMFKEPGIDSSIFPGQLSDNYIDTYHHANLNSITDCIYRDYYLESEENIFFPFEHCPDTWATQGVLILPTSLTTRMGNSGGHIKPWRKFTEAVINEIVENHPGTIFMLWGDEAIEYSKLLTNQHVFTWESPSAAVKANRDWHCNNFKSVDKLLNSLYGEKSNIHIKW